MPCTMDEVAEMEVKDKQMTWDDDWDQQAAVCIPFGSLDQDSESHVNDPFPRSEHDLPDGPLFRFQAYRKAWESCLWRVKDIIRNLQQSVVEDIVDTVQNAYVESPEDIPLPSSELVSLLVSSSDRAYIHHCLTRVVDALSKNVSNPVSNEMEPEAIPGAFISRISETDCQNATSLVKALIAGFIGQPLGSKGAKKIKPSTSLASHDMYILRAWYQAVQAQFGRDVPLIVVISDLHLVDATSLRALIEICSYHIPHIPLIFLLGSSDLNHLHSVLPRSTLACLRLEKYVLPEGVKTLEHVIQETFFSVNFVPNVMLGPGGLGMMFKEFERHNSTLDAFLSTLQLLHIQHFYNPLAFIGDTQYDTTLYNALDTPSEQWKPFFKLLRQYYISGFMTTGLAQGQLDWPSLEPQEVIEKMVEARSIFFNRMTRVKVSVRVLNIITSFAGAHNLKVVDMNFKSMAVDALRGSLGKKGVRNACNLIRQLQQTEVQALLEELYHYVHNLPTIARNMESKFKLELVLAQNDFDASKLARFLDFLTSHLEQTLVPFDDIAFLDVWWTGDIEIPNSPLNPNPHLSIVTALLEPHEYLGWTASSKSRDREELSSLPDVCILFRRYVESGKMINVYDWYESFAVALENSNAEKDERSMEVDNASNHREEGDKGKSIKQTDDESNRDEDRWKQEVHARFLRAMHELEFVGFLKHTGRKADHVMKTVFDTVD